MGLQHDGKHEQQQHKHLTRTLAPQPEEWKDTQDQARTAPLVVSESTCNNSAGGSRGKGRPYIRLLGFSDEENNDNDDETSSSGWIRFRIEEISKGNWWCLKVQGTGK